MTAMKFNQPTGVREPAANFRGSLQRLLPAAAHEANAAADWRLAETPEVCLDHSTDFWVTPRWLSIAHLDDRLAPVGHLNDTGHNAVRAQFKRMKHVELVAREPVTVAVALRRNFPGAGPQGVMRRRGE